MEIKEIIQKWKERKEFLTQVPYSDKYKHDEEVVTLSKAYNQITTELIEDLCELEKDSWILVKDRLPECDGNYLTYTQTGRYNTIGISQYDSEIKQFMSSFTTHWMPLPTAPKCN